MLRSRGDRIVSYTSHSPKLPLKPAIAYIRVSTERQARDGRGPEIQIAVIQKFARRVGFTLDRIFRDAESAAGEDSLRKRVGAVAAMRLALETDWPIIVAGYDRFSRNTLTIDNLVLRGRPKLISCSDGENAPYASILARAEISEELSETISRTTREGVRVSKERGVLFGNRTNLPEAQKKGAAANKANAQARVRELAPVIQALRDAGHVTAWAIADGLNTKGWPTPHGKDWTRGNVRNLLKQVAALDEAQEWAESLEDDSWGTW